MKLVEGKKIRQARRQSLRSTPYDLRRRVLVKNFLKEGSIGVKTSADMNCEGLQEDGYSEEETLIDPGPREKEQEISASSEAEPICHFPKAPREEEPVREKSGDAIRDQEEQEKTSKKANDLSPDTAEFLYLISRRLRISESSKLRQPCRSSRRLVLRKTRGMRRNASASQASLRKIFLASSSDSDQPAMASSPRPALSPRSRQRLRNRSSPPKFHPLRSYPTFHHLNKVFECNETVGETTIFMHHRMRRPELHSQTSRGGISRGYLLRSSLRHMLKKCKLDHPKGQPSSSSSGPSSRVSSSNSDTRESETELSQQVPTRNSIIHKIMGSVRRSSVSLGRQAYSRPTRSGAMLRSFKEHK